MLAALLLSASMFGPAAIDARVAGEPLCGAAGTLYACSDDTRAPICWDSRHQLLVACSALPADKDGTLRRAIVIVAGNGFDGWTTGHGIDHGGVEGNPLLPNADARWGAKAVTAALEIGLVELAARVLHKPTLANVIAGSLGAGYLLVGVHNLTVTRGP